MPSAVTPSVVPWESDIPLNLNTEGEQSAPQLAGLADGRFVAVWTDYQVGASTPIHIHEQLFNADGSRHGSEYSVALQSNASQDHAVVGLADGGFELAWAQVDPVTDGYAYKIVAQQFSPDGAVVGTPGAIGLSINDLSLSTPDLAARPDGSFVAAWQATHVLTTGAVDIEAQIVGPGNIASGDAAALTAGTQAFNPRVASLSDGHIVTAWYDDPSREVHGAILNADGTGVRPFKPTDPAGLQPVVTALASGNFALVWSAPHGIEGQIFNADGTAQGDSFAVNTSQDLGWGFPAITTLPDGRFVVVWTVYSAQLADQDFSDTRGQVFNPDGSKSGDEFVANAPSAGYHSYPTVTALADGRFVAGWDANGLDHSLGEHAQIFDPRDAAVHLVGSARDNDFVGTAFDDTMQGGGGNDRLDGGAGDDTAVFAHARDQYTITQDGDATIVAGPDGTTTLLNFEHLQFADGSGPPPAEPPPAPPPGAPPPEQQPDADIVGLFDTRYYLTHNGDVSAAKVSAIDHFNGYGWHEGRAPDAFFSTALYLAFNKDVAASGVNPLTEYHQGGWREGRDPGPAFDNKLYLAHNPDVAAAGADPLEHYLQHGMAEGRSIYAAVGAAVNGFDAEWYVFHNPDVAAAGVDPLQHYEQFGWREGRNPNAWFDAKGYLAHYADVAAAGIDPLLHYEQSGWKEGRDPSASFSTSGYLAANADVAAAHVNPLDHFINSGIYEGRAVVADGWH